MKPRIIPRPPIDVKHIHFLMMLAEHGTVSKAASVLGLTQPALSEHIARLEKKLNMRLVTRGPRGVTLTETGNILIRDGHRLVEAAENLADRVRSAGSAIGGHVSIGLPPSLSAILSIPLAETVRLEYPDIKLHISEGLSGHVADWVDQEIVDIGFVYAYPQRSSFQAEPVVREEMFIVAAHDNVPVPADENGNYTLSACDLSKLPLAMPSLSHSSRRTIERFARANNIGLNIMLEIDSLYQIVEIVGRASAYTFLPHGPVAQQVESGKFVLVKIVNPSFFRTIYLTRKSARPMSAASLKVESIILTIIRELLDRYHLNAQLVTDGSRLESFDPYD